MSNYNVVCFVLRESPYYPWFQQIPSWDFGEQLSVQDDCFHLAVRLARVAHTHSAEVGNYGLLINWLLKYWTYGLGHLRGLRTSRTTLNGAIDEIDLTIQHSRLAIELKSLWDEIVWRDVCVLPGLRESRIEAAVNRSVWCMYSISRLFICLTSTRTAKLGGNIFKDATLPLQTRLQRHWIIQQWHWM